MKKFLTVIAVLSALALTGCAKADTAASIGDITITQAQAQSKIDELLAERAKINTAETQFETGNALNRSQLRFTIITTVFDEIAKELKLPVSATELENARAVIYSQIGGEAELSKSLVAAQIAPSISTAIYAPPSFQRNYLALLPWVELAKQRFRQG